MLSDAGLTPAALLFFSPSSIPAFLTEVKGNLITCFVVEWTVLLSDARQIWFSGLLIYAGVGLGATVIYTENDELVSIKGIGVKMKLHFRTFFFLL